MLRQVIYKVLKYFMPLKIRSVLTPEFSGFLEAFPHPVFWIDKNKTYQGCNKVFADLMGLKESSEIIGLKDKDLPFPPDTLRKRNEIFEKILNDQAPAGVLYDYVTNLNNETIWAQKRFTPLKDSQGETIGVFGAIIDISERVDRRKRLGDFRELEHIFEDFIQDLNSTPIASWERKKIPEKAIIILKDLAQAKVAIWAKVNALSFRESLHFSTDPLDILELFEKRDVLSLKAMKGYLGPLEVNALKDIYADIESIFFYRLESRELPAYDDIILLINPNNRHMEDTKNIIGLIRHIIHYFYIHKFLISSSGKRFSVKKPSFQKD